MDMVDLVSGWKGGAGTALSKGRRTGVAGIDIGPDRAPSPVGAASTASFPGNRQRLAMRTPPAAPIQASTAHVPRINQRRSLDCRNTLLQWNVR
jgi:hypothetical protein